MKIKIYNYKNAHGVTIGDHEHRGSKNTFYPWCQVQRIEYKR